jgi:transposase InsO family protein
MEVCPVRGGVVSSVLLIEGITIIVEITIQGDKLYLSPMMDIFNGEIIAYETREQPRFPLVGNMLTKASDKLSGHTERYLLPNTEHSSQPLERNLISLHL